MKAVTDESGSAAVEFVLFTIPLLVPLAIFLTTASVSGSLEMDMSNYSRQLVRAYVTSPTDYVVAARLAEVDSAFQNKIFSHDAVVGIPTFEVQCSLQPCMSPGGVISVQVTARNSMTQKTFTTESSEIVDQWR
jgi:Flp pilus assembly protein TadG